MSHSPHLSPDWTPLGLERAMTCVVRAERTGFDYRVSVSVPEGEAPARGFPMLVVLDGDALFATVAETERRLSRRSEVTRVVPTVIVGVGPAGADLYDPAQRRRDFTPGPPGDPRDAGEGLVGGADAFLSFLLELVLPLAAERAPVDPARIGLMGHSLGGLFALEVLTRCPGAFVTYGVISPSIWWDRNRLTEAATRLTPSGVRVMLAVGELEQKPEEADARRLGRRMVDAVREMGAVLGRSLGSEAVEVFVLPDEDHASVVSAASVRVLRLIGG